MAESTMYKPEIETLDYHSPLCKCPECEKKAEPKLEQPNQQLMIIKTIQGLTACILNSITKLPESVLKDQAYDDMNIFETGILFKLQKEYE